MELIEWQPYFTIEDGVSKRQDGMLVSGDNIGLALDVASLSDTCCVLPDEAESADIVWQDEKVFLSQDIERHGAPTLIVPFQTLSNELVREAIGRFNP